MSLLWSSLIHYFVVELFTFLVSMVKNMTLFSFKFFPLTIIIIIVILLSLFFVIFILNFYNFNFFLLSFIAYVNLIRLFCFSYLFKSFNRQ